MTRPPPPGGLSAVVATVDDAIRDLTAMRCNDPASRDALRAVKLTAHTLRSFWVPTLDLLGDQTT